MATTIPAPVPHSRRPAPEPILAATASAPMRLSFGGGGTDLPPFLPGRGGRIVGSAIDLRVRALVEPFDAGWVRLELSAMDRVVTRRRGEPVGADIATRLLEAVLAIAGVAGGIRLRIETDLVPGAGLGGSASAAVAALAAVRAASGGEASPDELAALAIRAERDGLGLSCGAQDQLFAAFGGVLDLRFDESGVRDRRRLDVDPALLAELQAGLLLVDTGERRVSGEILVRSRPRPETLAELLAAADDVARGFAANSLAQILTGMRRNAAAKRQRDPEASAPATAIAARVADLGAEVVRACGAGAGGHVLVWAPPERHGAIVEAMAEHVVRRPALGAPGVRLET